MMGMTERRTANMKISIFSVYIFSTSDFDFAI